LKLQSISKETEITKKENKLAEWLKQWSLPSKCEALSLNPSTTTTRKPSARGSGFDSASDIWYK
jgi:hypothetical protein